MSSELNPRRTCYFDVTDIILFARGNSRVSGIQRVSIRLIEQVVRGSLATDSLHCVFFNPRDERWHEIPAESVFDEPEFNSGRLLARLGSQDSPRLQLKNAIKHHLRQYDHRKARRAVVKIKLLALSVLRPRRLYQIGLPRPYGLKPGEGLAPRPLPSLQRDDILIELGATWTSPASMTLCRQHVRAGGRVVQLIHDVIPAIRPELFPQGVTTRFNQFIEHLADGCSEYLCVSESTARDLRAVLLDRNQPGKPITVIPLAHEMEGFKRNTPPDQPDNAELVKLARQPFVLCVGTIEIRKNGTGLLQAWSALRNLKNVDLPRLVFAGTRGWGLQAFDQMLETHPELSTCITFLPSPTDRDLAYLYARCAFTVYPSFYEGWGLPPGEAAWFGAFSIVSSTSALPEVLGPLADYVNPDRPESIVDAVVRATSQPEELSRRKRAVATARLRTWKDVGHQLGQYLSNLSAPAAPTPTEVQFDP